MKPLNRIFVSAFFLILHYSCAVQQPAQQSGYYAPEPTVNFQVFYDELSPYGQWVDYPGYGYVWMPEVRRHFSPYSTDGYWVNTEYGWTWVSDYKWGWAPFHYGRWDYDDFYGWFWVPDNVWGPSWVTWRSGNGYYGWAPMRPGINLSRSFNDGYRDINRWNFVGANDFGRTDLNRYYVDRHQYNTIINNTTVVNNTTVDRRRNTTYVAGPSQDDVQNLTGRRINRVTVEDTDRPGSRLNNDQLRIFRPQVQESDAKGQRPAPTSVATLDEVKSASERNTGNRRSNVDPYDNNTRDQQLNEPGRQIQRRRQERQMQPADRPQEQQKSQPLQPQVTPQQQSTDEQQLRLERQQQQQMEKYRQSIERQQQQETRRQEREQVRQQQQIERQQQQMQKSQPVQPQVTTTPERLENEPQRRRREEQQR